jgi:hypothetical protein
MFRRARRLFALTTALFLLGLQTHALWHGLLGHEEASDKPCAVCVQGLQQQAVSGPAAVSAPEAPSQFSVLAFAAPAFVPAPRLFVPSLRGPPTVS